MAKPRSAGSLDQRVAFDKRIQIDDGAGNTVGDWQEQFQRSAGFVHMRGGEAVMAGRLQGQHTQVVLVRSCVQTRLVGTDWRIRDVRTGTSFNIRDVTPSDDRAWLDFLCQSGVADG